MIHIIYILFFLFLVVSLFYNLKKAIEQLIDGMKNNKENLKESISILEKELRLPAAWHKIINGIKKYIKSNSTNKYYFCTSIFLLILMGEIINGIFWKYIILFIVMLMWVRIIYNILYYQDNEIKIPMIFFVFYTSLIILITSFIAQLNGNYFNNTLFTIFMFINFITLILAIKIFLNTDMKPIIYDIALLMLLFYAGLIIISSYFLIGWGAIYYELNMGDKNPNSYTLNIKESNDVYAQMMAFIYNGVTTLQSFDTLEVVNIKDKDENKGDLTKNVIIFRMLSVFFSYIYISIITAFFINLFTQGKKK